MKLTPHYFTLEEDILVLARDNLSACNRRVTGLHFIIWFHKVRDIPARDQRSEKFSMRITLWRGV